MLQKDGNCMCDLTLVCSCGCICVEKKRKIWAGMLYRTGVVLENGIEGDDGAHNGIEGDDVGDVIFKRGTKNFFVCGGSIFIWVAFFLCVFQ